MKPARVKQAAAVVVAALAVPSAVAVVVVVVAENAPSIATKHLQSLCN
jgi:hypothetical protein